MPTPEPKRPYARPAAFTRPDPEGIGTEVEVSRFIGDLTRLLAPEVVVETGTGHGDTAREIMLALEENARRGVPGHLWTFERLPARVEAARALLHSPHVDVVDTSITLWRPPGPIALAFIDSAYATRLADVDHVMRWLTSRGLIVVHDVEMPQARDLVDHLEAKYQVIRLATPRGLALVQPSELPPL